MKLNDSLIEVLKFLDNAGEENISRHLFLNKNSAALIVNQSKLLEINSTSIILNGKKNIESKILTKGDKLEKNSLKTDLLYSFIKKAQSLPIRLNHLGVNYFCKNVEKELGEYGQAVRKSKFKIYEEELKDLAERCFFIGDTLRWEAPLFEVTLLENKSYSSDYWRPHFQIDLDTNLDFETLRKTAKTHFGPDFFKYTINIPNHGIVFGIGRLGSVQGVKICLGVGTRLRITEYHRKVLLKEVV